jgi:hypothetical protein
MLDICWYCDDPVDVDECMPDDSEFHRACALDLATNGSHGEWLDIHTRLANERRRTYLSDTLKHVGRIRGLEDIALRKARLIL